MTVDELEHRMTYAEFAEWAAFYQIEPWGCEVQDSRMAMQCAAAIAPYAKGKASPDKFMPDRDRRKKITDPKKMAQAMIAWAKANKGLVRYTPDGGEVDCQTEHQPRG